MRKSGAARAIELRGVRVHNLKNLDLDIPLGKLVVLTGVSGSGKSSLAFDTLFLEGQRRYIESFSTSARRQLERIERPNADRIAHVPVAIAVRSDRFRGSRPDARSTVGTMAELLDALRLIFARLGKIYCPGCGRPIEMRSADDLVATVTELPEGARCQIIFATASPKPKADTVAAWLARGFSRAIWDGKTHDLSGKPKWPKSKTVWIVADRIVAGKASPARILESTEVAMREGEGQCELLTESQQSDPTLTAIDGRNWKRDHFSRKLACFDCHREFLLPDVRLFNHMAFGACPNCRGTGKSSAANAAPQSCPACEGTRLREEARIIKVADHSFADLTRLGPSSLLRSLSTIAARLRPEERTLIEFAQSELRQRLQSVCDLGLDYLTLDRAADSLSGGELRRLMLAALVGSRITGTLVVVDEPSDGLAPSEIENVTNALRQVQALHNSVIVVDHSPLVVRSADHVVELGPGAGPEGGALVSEGPPISVTDSSSLIAEVSRLPNTIDVTMKTFRLSNVHHRNLQGLDFEFPINKLCVVTGPSGAGKTSLITEVLYPIACRQRGISCNVASVGSGDLSGADGFVDVVLIDQLPLAKSARSNPATWLEVFDEIRQTFAMTSDAKQRGFTAQHFSFNSKAGGRCRSCDGTGVLKHDMQFLPDVTLTCPECHGTRYRKEILEVKYRNRTIADILAMSVSEAASFFRSQPRLQNRFRMLEQIGLDYLVLGQPSETLSGGESQRLKLASRLMMPNRGTCLIICDDPTSGLHPRDVGRLITCFRELLANGHSIILADNSPELLSAADHVTDVATITG